MFIIIIIIIIIIFIIIINCWHLWSYLLILIPPTLIFYFSTAETYIVPLPQDDIFCSTFPSLFVLKSYFLFRRP